MRRAYTSFELERSYPANVAAGEEIESEPEAIMRAARWRDAALAADMPYHDYMAERATRGRPAT